MKEKVNLTFKKHSKKISEHEQRRKNHETNCDPEMITLRDLKRISKK
jgi:hypothetical protein